MLLKKTAIISCVAIFLSGCAGMGPYQTGGTMLGAAGGAVLGSQFGHGAGSALGAAIGATAGAMGGNYLGKQIDNSNQK